MWWGVWRGVNYEFQKIKLEKELYVKMCQTAMRSFVEASDHYSVQWEYDKALSERGTTLTPFSRLRLVDITGGADLSAGVDLSLQKLNVRDGFAHMQRLRDALNALDRCGWRRSYHQRQFHEVRKTLNPKP